MIEIPQAIRHIRANCRTLPAEDVALRDSVGRVLADPIASDVDSPPFDKSMMDGFAVISADMTTGSAELEVVDRVQAGSLSARTLYSGQAIAIMTGAPVPDGADAVVMIEQTTESSDGNRQWVTIKTDECRAGQNILTRGRTMSCGETVMSRGHSIRAEDIGLLSEAGCARCKVYGRPTMSVIATGDELVDVQQKPQASQIRNSNGPMLMAMGTPLCSEVRDLGIGADRREHLSELIRDGLESDVLVLSGGVSAGVADLVPELLTAAGVKEVFHKVSIKPGKPIWFGKLERDHAANTLVFGLPGNPVSSMVCFHVFVAHALRCLAGSQCEMEYVSAGLSRNHSQRPGRTTFWPANLTESDASWNIEPLDWKGSADLKTLAAANCFAIFPGGQEKFESGEIVEVMRIS